MANLPRGDFIFTYIQPCSRDFSKVLDLGFHGRWWLVHQDCACRQHDSLIPCLLEVALCRNSPAQAVDVARVLVRENAVSASMELTAVGITLYCHTICLIGQYNQRDWDNAMTDVCTTNRCAVSIPSKPPRATGKQCYQVQNTSLTVR